MNAAGSFLPPPREMRAVIQGAFTAPITAASPTAANGIVYGQYHAPILEYIFPENVPGAPIVENNFNNIAFLAHGRIYLRPREHWWGSSIPGPATLSATDLHRRSPPTLAVLTRLRPAGRLRWPAAPLERRP